MIKTGSFTDIGMIRDINQDYFYVSDDPVGQLPDLFIVADGMGGHAAGEFASRCAVTSFVEAVKGTKIKDPAKVLSRGVAVANKNIRTHAAAHLNMKGMGTTLVAATIAGSHLTVLNVGDSRLYVSGDKLTQITEDHSLVREMIRIGEMDEGSASASSDRNIITRAVGVEVNVIPDFFDVELRAGQKILLCTDGLTNMLTDSEIQEIMQMKKDPNHRAELLVAKANERGGADNITVIIAEPEFEEEQE